MYWVCFPGTSAQVGLNGGSPAPISTSIHHHHHQQRSYSLGLVNPLPACGREYPNVINTHAVGPIQENSAPKNPNSQNLQVEGTGSPLRSPPLIASTAGTCTLGVSVPKCLRSPLQVHFPPGATSTQGCFQQGRRTTLRWWGLQALSNAWAWSSDPHPSCPSEEEGQGRRPSGLKAYWHP